ncbi:MAG: sulfite exporter TauE/SafE family protein [Planctomycetes bacterium]|nr:sulfite exporter TauE/SafE family protein [Planctomycetota bacterium]
MDATVAAALVVTGFGAGVMNALAGGGTILTFPAMMLLGISPLQANATSTVALVPGAAASLWGYRREVGAHREWMRTLLLPSLIGGTAGSVLLVLTPETTFSWLAPWLVLFATTLFGVQIVTSRRADATDRAGDASSEVAGRGPLPGRLVWAWLFQFGVAVYGGYFGAGIGILMIVTLGYLGLRDILAINGLKNFFGMCINGMACACFILAGLVSWPVALVTMAGTIAGGLAGARFARFVGREKARWAVVAVGLVVTGAMLWQRNR